MADLVQIGGAAAIKYCGGPTILIKIGRKDLGKANPPNKLVNVFGTARDAKDTYLRMTLNHQELVCLMGSHTLGGAKKERSGF